MPDKTLKAIIKLKDEFSKPLKVVHENMKATKEYTDSTSKSIKDYQKNMKAAGKTAAAVGGAITASVGGALVASSKVAMDFESAFAGVKKTVEATEEQLMSLRDGIIDMSNKMPQSASDIAGVAEVAGQLGIETNNILKFTEAMIMLGDSTNMSSETAAMELAKFANITRMSQLDFDKLGSTIVDLGNNLATTEADISSMALRLAGAGSQVGLSEAQILSFAGALSSVGIEAEMGGSAFSKIMVQIQSAVEGGGEALGDFAKVAGMSSKQFSDAFKNDAAGALVTFLKGIQDTERHGKSAIGVLNDLGVEEVRLRDTLLRASSAHDLFNSALDIGTNAWKENNALVQEASQRYGTTESQLAIMRNQITNAGIEIGTALLPAIRDAAEFVSGLATKFNELDPGMKKAIINGMLIITALGIILTIGGGLLIFLGSCVTAFTALSGAGAILATILGAINLPLLVIVLAIGAVIGAVILLKKAWDNNFNGIRDKTLEICEKVKDWWGGLKEWFLSNPIVATVKETWDKVTGKNKSSSKRNAFGGKVTRNDELRRLHEGEKVLTKREANMYEKGTNGTSVTVHIAELVVREEADVTKVANEIAKRINRSRLAFGGAY